MAYKRKSPLNTGTAYSNPSGAIGDYSKLKTTMPTNQLSANGESSSSDDKIELDPEKLKNKGDKKYYPKLQEKLANAKNAKQSQKIENKIDRKSNRHKSKANRNQMEDNIKRASQEKRLLTKEKEKQGKMEDKAKRKGIDVKVVTEGSPAKYLNPNTMAVQGDAGQSQETNDMNVMPNRAGRPINSNVLMNDPMNYQDPSKISAQQNSQEQMFSNMASSSGDPSGINPNTGLVDQKNPMDPNQMQSSPFNKKGEPDKVYQAKEGGSVGAGGTLPELTVTPNYSSHMRTLRQANDPINDFGNEKKQMARDLKQQKIGRRFKEVKQQKIGRAQEMVPTKELRAATVMNKLTKVNSPEKKIKSKSAVNPLTNSPLNKTLPNPKEGQVRMQKKKKKIKNTNPKFAAMGLVSLDDVKQKNVSEKRAKRMEKRGWKESLDPEKPRPPKKEAVINGTTYTVSGNSPFNKTGWIQDVNKDIERRGTKGVCTGDKFGSASCPPGSKRYNLAKTFKKMNKK